MDWTWVIIAAVAAALFSWFFRRDRPVPEEPRKFHLGDITLDALITYCGYDYSKPILLAIKGKVYDVTKAAAKFGPGKPLHVYAGREVARALALGSVREEDCGGDAVHDLGADEAQRLADAVAEYDKEYDVVGQVVPLKELTLQQLAQHDGSDPTKPLYLAIKGTIFDVSKGSQFYGPDGVYPFAGHECARALALISTDLKDCNGDLSDLGYAELENLREWDAKFRFKYPIVGKLIG
mmetsp:Transcript_28129/g.71726  ORF Transcript_28129/g.71726 Transcript_28129/m.71726 type:complete len:237 (-) Transcript_28129:118-828(-)|eukprot:CAMPEP_0202878102 /NCGR_PEP_ID=MMETSP1391-20130828/31644_1 /ASSEMBLY_ACC=CAM_ASM_000867 /TAXON_ID=1034604 /ORGANISM="Chlamydomonas leiostraca, Strain SAG 11-49" /LENGTH=236 /DNA_ID=CAMNT_0049560243 /DNA_START=46 /DNA_END=756 /DNA_ORIENTATION=+